MIALPNDHTALPDSGTLTTLRAFATPAPMTIDDALRITNQQAHHMRSALAGKSVIDTLAKLVPSVSVELIDEIPVAALSFWGGGRWHIHLRASDPTDLQSFTALHQLKHIIDHPLRRTSRLSDVDHEALANHFANRVITGELATLSPTQSERRAYE